ncbi:ATP-grasp domain-containing protein [Paraburkholderia franconis]|uniref:ATP-grasp domain-containing protein n=1 Tax=Paraburkholderia franconis TaxID=2654983 RepID=UPI00128D44DD|nr:ATP-grasp domain-containing protein [Paraburkholderia franconis]
MKHEPQSIAVTGIGGGAGQSIVKALQSTTYRIVGLDGDLLGAGLYAVPSAYQIPYAKHPDFISALLDICAREKVAMLFPGLDAELPILAANVDKFSAVGTRVVVSSSEVVEIADNKLRTFETLRAANVSIPETVDLSAIATAQELPLAVPFILKPRSGGARSKSVYLIKEERQFHALRDNSSVDMTQFVAQAYIEGDEYTCGTVTLNGQHAGTIVMRRILRDGDTYKCFTVDDARIEEEVAKVVAAVQPSGPLNVQLRVQNGVPYIFELNARCSGTTGARALAGFNEPQMIADFFLKGHTPSFSIKPVSILRYWKELVVENDAISRLREAGHIEATEHPQL